MSSFTHPEDVLRFLTDTATAGRSGALVAITETVGGGLRAPGALMAVDEAGRFAGYMSNGCVDADVILNAREAIRDGKPRNLTYGAGSPFLDIRLPCGGRLSMIVVPMPDTQVISTACAQLESRTGLGLKIAETGISLATHMPDKTAWDGDLLTMRVVPKLHLRIAGRGEELLALGRLAAAADFAVTVQSPDDITLSRAKEAGLAHQRLTTPHSLPALQDDEWTAFILMFHDQDWEVPLVRQTLNGPAFWLGAVGSRRTHQVRCEALREAGVSTDGIRRLNGPIGLIPRTRDASMLAVSTLAEIAGSYKDLNT
ncbi:XdhC family protein [Pyruvatibacter sp.]|uniref:XdhC family protein n=1 Tax=Pyruvatibacter sp. TaxID=1981328 RepID=UPI0032EDEFE3